MLNLLISKTAVSWSWPVWCGKIALGRPDSLRGPDMDTAVGSAAHTAPFDWRDLYLQALFETDRSHVYARIAEAERTLYRREHALFADSNARVEREAVANALNALHALRSCLGFESTVAAA
jgi:hypothetical protein